MKPRFPLLLPRRDTWMSKSGCAALTSPLPWPPAGFLLFLPSWSSPSLTALDSNAVRS